LNRKKPEAEAIKKKERDMAWTDPVKGRGVPRGHKRVGPK